MITVVCWKWKSRPGYHTTYTADHVNRLRSMVSRHLRMPHDFVCVTDDAAGLDAGIRVVPITDEIGYHTHPRRPNCYRRLRAFAPDAAEWLGPRFLSIDLDCVIVGDITPLASRTEDFVIMGDGPRNRNGTPYCGSLWLLTAGARTRVWESFDPQRSPEITKRAGIIGSDQAWIAHVLGPHEARFSTADGVIGYGRDVLKKRRGVPPPHTRMVFFYGLHDPSRERHRHAWVREHWR